MTENILINYSKKYYSKAKKLMPGGVSSPVRAIKPFPFYVKKAYGPKLYDVDNNEYLDFCLGYGPLILGHSNKNVKLNIINQLENGWLYGTPCVFEIELAEILIKYYNSIEMIRFTSTGTEATMSAIRLARGFTKKNKIIKIKGGFHGSHDSVLIKADSGFLTNNSSIYSGIPSIITNNTLQIEYNNIEELVELIECNKLKEDIACLIIEPVLGNIGCINPEKNYLSEIRKITTENDILLIFDEVITGCRLSLGGAQNYYNIKPDITTLGKIIGGGLPIGAFGAKKELMKYIAPTGQIYHAGTFSGNPLSLCSGISTLKYLEQNDVCNKLNQKCLKFYNELNDIIIDNKFNFHLEYISSMFTLFFSKKPFNYNDVLKCDINKYNYFLKLMLDDGIFLSPSQFETNFISYIHEDVDFNKTIEAFEKNIKKVEHKI